MCRSSSTTEGWNTTERARRAGNSRRSRSRSGLIDLRDILLGCNRRYIATLSALDDFLPPGSARWEPPDRSA